MQSWPTYHSVVVIVTIISVTVSHLGTGPVISTTDATSYKNKLQEHFQKLRLLLPEYETQSLPNGCFISTVSYTTEKGQRHHIKGNECTTKKSAEQSAAQKACLNLKLK